MIETVKSIGTVQKIFAHVEDHTGISTPEILGQSRHQDVHEARRLIAVAMRELDWSYPRIGRALDRDHSTVMTMMKRATDAEKDRGSAIGQRVRAHELALSPASYVLQVQGFDIGGGDEGTLVELHDPRNGTLVTLPARLAGEILAVLEA